MNKKTFIALLTTTLLMSSSVQATATKAAKVDEVSKIETELAKGEKVDMKYVYIELELIAQSLTKKFDQAELEKVLGLYKKINKIDNKHYYVEMFVSLYKSHKEDFSKSLKKALSEEDQKEFMRKLELAVTESEEGNG